MAGAAQLRRAERGGFAFSGSRTYPTDGPVAPVRAVAVCAVLLQQ